MICPASLAFFLVALSPACWNSRNRRRISLWSSFSKTMASDVMVPLRGVAGAWYATGQLGTSGSASVHGGAGRLRMPQLPPPAVASERCPDVTALCVGVQLLGG